MGDKKKILVIDDETDICLLLQEYLSQHGYAVSIAYSGNTGMNLLEKEDFDLVLTDFRLGDIDGLELIIRLKKIKPNIPVIMITGYSDIKIAVRVIKLGAYDYVTKPLYPDEILLTVQKALAETGNGKANARKDKYTFVTGESAEMRAVMKELDAVADTAYRVILYGESGTGKESVAQVIHDKSERRHKPFMAIDCGALSRETAGNELFGCEKNALKGVLHSRAGQFELANGGTLFMDEVSDLSAETQILLLRVLQENRIQRISDTKDIPVDVRVIVASNENLALAVEKGKFRQDLYYRLNEFSIRIPPLRERKRDIMVLADYFLRDANQELNKNIQGFTSYAADILLSYSWPGNVRQLKNVIRRAALLTDDTKIEKTALPKEIISEVHISDDQKMLSESDKPAILRLKDSAQEAEAATILQVLREVNFNRTKAAKLLNIDRKTLYNKMRLLRILE